MGQERGSSGSGERLYWSSAALPGPEQQHEETTERQNKRETQKTGGKGKGDERGGRESTSTHATHFSSH